MARHSNLNRKGSPDPLARKAGWERKVRHQSRLEKLKALPKVKEGRLLDDDRAWMAAPNVDGL